MTNSILQGLRLGPKVSKGLRATYETVTGRLRDDKTRNLSGTRVTREWLKYAAMLIMLLTLGCGNAWGATDMETVLDSSLPIWAKIIIVIAIALLCGGYIVIKKYIKVNNSKNEDNSCKIATNAIDHQSRVTTTDIHGNDNHQTNVITDNITINNISQTPKDDDANDDSQDYTQAKLKTHILFVDDNDFPIMQSIKEAGWKNVEYIEDITNLDCVELKIADIVFVDIQGVGKKLYKNEGVGLGAAIKQRYKSKKKVIIYSAESNGNRFDPDLQKADYLLSKDAEPYQFINLIENFSHE